MTRTLAVACAALAALGCRAPSQVRHAPNPGTPQTAGVQNQKPSGVSDLATRQNMQSSRPAADPKKLQPPKELATAEVVVNAKTGEGSYALAEFITSETWMFWRREDNGDGIVTWTFVRPKHPGAEFDDLRPKPGAR